MSETMVADTVVSVSDRLRAMAAWIDAHPNERVISAEFSTTLDQARLLFFTDDAAPELDWAKTSESESMIGYQATQDGITFLRYKLKQGA